jgi:hypothetical protein
MNYFFILKYPLVQPVITPRFAITCSMELMKKLGDLALQYDTNIQVIFFLLTNVTFLTLNQYFCFRLTSLKILPNVNLL